MYDIKGTEKFKIGRFNIIMDFIKKGKNIYPYSYIEFIDGVCILPFIDENNIILLKEYRHPLKKWMYNFPSGMLDKYEKPVETAKREIIEETGYKIDKIIDLGIVYPSFGSTTEKIYLYAAKVSKFKKIKQDKLELIDLEICNIKEFEQKIDKLEFTQGAGLSIWLKWLRYENKSNLFKK